MNDAVGFIFLGMVVAVVGGAVLTLAGDNGLGVIIGALITALGAIFAQVGTIAAGVILGLRTHRNSGEAVTR